MKIASGKKWITVIAAVLMVCVCALASAQSYSLGDEADEIATIQTALKKLKLYTGDITGHYGSLTEQAVKKFQKSRGITQDGIAGTKTLNAIASAAAGAGSSALGGSNSAGTSLRKGDTNNTKIGDMQTRLKKLGFYYGDITNHFGTMTQAAVMKFQ